MTAPSIPTLRLRLYQHISSQQTSWSGLVEELLILLEVALQDVLDGSQESLELLAADGEQFAFGDCPDAGLTDCVLHEGDFSEVLLLLVLEDHVLLARLGVILLGHEVALDHEVEAVAVLALLDHVVIGLEQFFLEGVAKLLLFVVLHVGEDLDAADDLLVVAALADGRLLDDVDEGESVEGEDGPGLTALDGCGPLGVVHEGKFTEQLARLVGLEVGGLAVDDLRALVLARRDHVQHVSRLALPDHLPPHRAPHFLHRPQHHAHVLLRQPLEHDRLLQQSADQICRLLAFGVDLGREGSLLVVVAEDLSADALAAVLLAALFLHLLLEFAVELFFLLARHGLLFRGGLSGHALDLCLLAHLSLGILQDELHYVAGSCLRDLLDQRLQYWVYFVLQVSLDLLFPVGHRRIQQIEQQSKQSQYHWGRSRRFTEESSPSKDSPAIRSRSSRFEECSPEKEASRRESLASRSSMGRSSLSGLRVLPSSKPTLLNMLRQLISCFSSPCFSPSSATSPYFFARISPSRIWITFSLQVTRWDSYSRSA